jgi:hypothetical protein
MLVANPIRAPAPSAARIVTTGSSPKRWRHASLLQDESDPAYAYGSRKLDVGLTFGPSLLLLRERAVGRHRWFSS